MISFEMPMVWSILSNALVKSDTTVDEDLGFSCVDDYLNTNRSSLILIKASRKMCWCIGVYPTPTILCIIGSSHMSNNLRI